MVESKKEKRVRFFLIFFFIALTVFGIILNSNQMSDNQNTDKQLAAVIQKSEGKNDNPIVAISEFKQGSHVLALYEIERNNSYFFRTIEAIELRDSPDELANDDAENGVWMNLSDKWYYFDGSLKEEERSLERRTPSEKIKYTVQKTDKGGQIVLSDNKKISVGQDELVEQIHSLSKDEDLYLVITNTGVKISTIE